MRSYMTKTRKYSSRFILKMFFYTTSVLFCCLGLCKNVNAETKDDACNAGDIVTVRYGIEDSDEINTLGDFEVEKDGLVGKNFVVKVSCEGDGYKFSVLDIVADGETKPTGTLTGNVVLAKDMNENGEILENGESITTRVDFGGDYKSYIFWMSKVQQKDDTANPETEVPDGAYNPTITPEQNIKDGTATQSPIELPIEKKEKDQCHKGSGIVGWIICPIINGISGIGEWLWGQIESNFLKLPSGALFRDNNGVEVAWRSFRDIANLIFIILFMIVIFSQLTGIGIDNFGIKKILSKLIVVAILINLSYLICILAVDLSNVLGTGLNDLFSSLANSIPIKSEGASGSQYLAVIGITGGGALLFTMLTGPLGIISAGLCILGIIITIVVSMLFLFLVLMIRNAGVVILIAIAPIAIVCYMLPNTEKFYKKWFDLLKSLLFVYPICGALVGAGKLAGNILASTGTEAMTIAGMIVEVLPFFLIPTLLKQSLSLAGNIGAKLSATGRSLGRRGSTTARGAITNSGRFKDWSQVQAANKAGRIQRKLEGKVNRGGTLSRWQRAKLRAAQDTVLAQNRAEEENKLRATGGYTEAMTYKQNMATRAETEAISRLNDPTVRAAEERALEDDARRKREAASVALMMSRHSLDTQDQLADRWDAAFESGDAEDLSALTTVMHRRFGSAGMNAIASKLSEKTDIKDNINYQTSMQTLQRTLNENGSMAGDMKSKASDAFQMISNGGIAKDENGNIGYQDMSWFSNNNGVATKSTDWASSSAATLQRGLAGTKEDGEPVIDDKMLDELLTSDDPTIAAFRSDARNRNLLQAAKEARESGTDFASIANDKDKIKNLSSTYEARLQNSASTNPTPQPQAPVQTPQIILGGTNSDINAASRQSGFNDSNAARRNNNGRQMNL